MMLRNQGGGTKRSYNQSTRRMGHNFDSLAAVDPIGLDVRTLLLQIGVYRNPYLGLYTETKWSP